MYVGLHVFHPLFLSHLNPTWILSTDFGAVFKCQYN